MCGICGVFNRDRNDSNNVENIFRMMKKLVHRGPDDSGYYSNIDVTLGFVRLSIVDLETGVQPMFNEDKSVAFVCNGEIYNYKELREDLKQKGHWFKTECDVEVISHLYEELGIEFVKKLNGQFAIAVYDLKKKALYCVRDQVGISPLFYTTVNDTFVFASEIKALLEYPGVIKEIDLTALDQVLSFPGIISPKTILKDIKSLESGHYIEITEEGIENVEYWDLDYSQVEEGRDEAYYCNNLREILTKSVQYRLNASVPVGFYISGGLDSSIIAALINLVGSETVRHSFSIDFIQKEMSERKYQRMMLNKIKSLHHERLFGIDDIISNLKNAVYYSESVLKETYNTASLVLSGLVNEMDIKVVLTGEGADELFGGYVGYKFDKMRHGNQRSQQLSKEDMEINELLWGDPYYIFEKNHGEFNKLKKELYSKNLLSELGEFQCTNKPVINTEKLKNMDLLQKRSYIDFKMRLSDHLLSDHGDRMVYANSVEARYPFLDINVIEYASTIPSCMKLKGFNEKYILKEIAKEIVPSEIAKRPKFAFVAPGSSDIMKRKNEYIDNLLSYETIKKQGVFNPDYIERLKEEYSRENFKLNLPYDSDKLIVVMTMGILMDVLEIDGV